MDSGKPITPARAIAIVKLLCKNDDARAVAALIELIHGIAEEHGDPDRSAAALEAMRFAYTLTPEFNRSFEEYLESGPSLDILQSDNDNH